MCSRWIAAISSAPILSSATPSIVPVTPVKRFWMEPTLPWNRTR
jgi:hypothetical protein